LKVLQLLRSGGNDAEMEETWNKIGDYFAERHKWDEAVQYYEKARNVDQVEMTLNFAFLQRRKINN
jgi:WD repeat-containing protein 35